MHELRRQDYQRALSVLAAADPADEPFGLDLIDALFDAVSAEQVAYVEWRFGDDTALRVCRPERDPRPDDTELVEVLAACCSTYPLRDVDHATSVEPLRLTDVVHRRALQESPFYALLMRPFGVEHELKLWLPAPPGHARFFELIRGAGRDFTDRDRALLALLRPHLAKLRARLDRRPCRPPLTEREADVMQLVALGLTNREIAQRLFISPATVRTHLEHVFDKLDVRSRAAAVSAAFAA
ncbi:MAG: helix-turn-helix transcriptional regulator [Gaiellaceae bacterium]